MEKSYLLMFSILFFLQLRASKQWNMYWEYTRFAIFTVIDRGKCSPCDKWITLLSPIPHFVMNFSKLSWSWQWQRSLSLCHLGWPWQVNVSGAMACHKFNWGVTMILIDRLPRGNASSNIWTKALQAKYSIHANSTKNPWLNKYKF